MSNFQKSKTKGNKDKLHTKEGGSSMHNGLLFSKV